ncbi:MAG: putative DNA-binding protein (MmcQ/YjbR family) [Candidatus Azotimanducaceae bacterium]|jgi:predicted DNA-binding protein (MmcQ/YjbR family)
MHPIREYLLARPEAWKDFPFRLDVAVIKVQNKMFATLARSGTSHWPDVDPDSWQMNLKCEPEQAMMLRDVFPAVKPGYHMNKAHWNTVILDGTVPTGELERMIDHSYGLVVRSMTRRARGLLEIHYSAEELYRSS